MASSGTASGGRHDVPAPPGQAAQPRQVLPVHLTHLRRLEDLRHRREAPVAHQQPERRTPHEAAPDVLMAIHPAAEVLLRVVDVEAADPLEADPPVDLLEDRCVPFRRAEVVAGREQMAGVHAHSQPLPCAAAREDLLQVLEAVSQRRPLPRRGLEQQADA